jgi:hypothetical protein
MQSVRIQTAVDSEMSLDFVRLDMSKPCDSHSIVMRKELRGAALPVADALRSARRKKLRECGVTRARYVRVNGAKSKGIKTLARSQGTTLPHATITWTV